MAQSLVEIVADSRTEPVEIHIDEKPVATGLDTGERYWEQIGKRWPLEPITANRCTCKGKTKWQDRCDLCVERIRFRLGRRNQFLLFRLAPEIPELDFFRGLVFDLAKTSVAIAVPT